MIDPSVKYLARERPWEPWHPQTNPGLCHDYNPLLRENFKDGDKEWWGHVQPGTVLHKALVSSFTMFMGEDYNRIVFEKHRRLHPLHDGLIEEAGSVILRADRCGCPDYMLEEGEATGSGSWRPGCLGNNDRHEVKFHVDSSRSSVKEWWDSIKAMVIAAYADMGMALIETQVRSEAHIVVSWEVLAGSVIGLAQLPGSGHCQLGYFCKLDPGYRPNSNQVAQLWAHELGHNMNSGHISGDPIMHPSMGNKNWNGSFRGTAYGSRLTQFFGGEPIPNPNPTPPGPPGDALAGLATIIVGGQQYSVVMTGRPK